MNPFASEPPITLLLIVVTCVVTIAAFRNRLLEDRLIFRPLDILAARQYHRMVTSAFLHSGWPHLFFNMFALHSFASTIEMYLGAGNLLAIYFSSIVGGSLLSLYLHRHHEYSAYGASGGVCGVIFAHIALFPGGSIYLLFIPIPIPDWLFAIAFILISFFALKGGRGNIGHDAHLGGAIIGLLMSVALHPASALANWKFITAILAISGALLFYLVKNPMFLPLSVFLERFRHNRKARQTTAGGAAVDPAELDTILEKISKLGINSLSSKERALLDRESERHRRG